LLSCARTQEIVDSSIIVARLTIISEVGMLYCPIRTINANSRGIMRTNLKKLI